MLATISSSAQMPSTRQNVSAIGAASSSGVDTDLKNLERATRPSVKDKVILLTELPRKVQEWQVAMNAYGLTVEAAPRPQSDEMLRNLASRSDVRFVCEESSNLYMHDGKTPCDWKHSEDVVHTSTITIHRVRNGQLTTTTYESSKRGFLDLISGGRTADGCWDSAFRLSSTGESYLEQRRKCSATSEALSKVMKHELHYPTRSPAAEVLPSEATRAVSFTLDGRFRLQNSELFRTQSAQELHISALLEGALQRGVFERRARARPQAHPWDSNFTGVPVVPKPDPIHQATYQFHDLMHMIVGEAVLVDETDTLSRQIYFLSRMQSEASSLFLSDGLFSESMRRSGVDYNYSARKAHPFLITTLGFTQGCPGTQEFRDVIKANAHFFVLGDTSYLERLFSKSSDPHKTFEDYTQWYSTFSHVDAEWTRHNMHQLMRQGATRRAWWKSLCKVRAEHQFLNLRSVSELKGHLGWHAPARSRDELGLLLDAIVDESFDRNIAPFIGGVAAPPLTDHEYCRRGFIRWMCGQLYFHFADGTTNATIRARSIITDELERFSSALPDSSVQAHQIRSEYDRSIDHELLNDRINSEQAELWKDLFPHVKPYYLSYRAGPDPEKLEHALDSILGNSHPRTYDAKPIASLLINDGHRFLVFEPRNSESQGGAQSTLSLLGGASTVGDKLIEVEYAGQTLFRNLHQQLPNTKLASEIYHASRLLGVITEKEPDTSAPEALAFFVASVSPNTFDTWATELCGLGSIAGDAVAIVVSKQKLRDLLSAALGISASLRIALQRFTLES